METELQLQDDLWRLMLLFLTSIDQTLLGTLNHIQVVMISHFRSRHISYLLILGVHQGMYGVEYRDTII